MSNEPVVLAEIPLTGGQIHALAQGGGQTFSDGMFGIRFILKSSFKLPKGNFVVKKFVMQVITKGKLDTVKADKVATVIKVEKGESKVKERKKVTEQLIIESDVGQKSAW